MMDGLKDDMLAEISELIDSGRFINGPDVAEFEEAFATYCGTTRCVGVASGLDALRLALIAAGLEPGDEVIVPAQTFIATFEAVTQAGGVPVVVDISERDYNIDPEAAEPRSTARTRFVLPVHLYGQMADMRALGRSRAPRAQLVEDACQAHGAERDGLRAGRCGLAGRVQLLPGKNLGADGRRRRAGRRTTTSSPTACARCASTARRAEVPARARGLHGPAGHACRRSCCCTSFRSWTSGTTSAVRPRASTSRRSTGVGDLRAAARSGGQQPGLAPVSSSARPTRRASQSFLGARASRRAGTIRSRVHLSRAYAQLGQQPGAFPVAEALAREVPVAPDLSRDRARSSSTPSSTPIAAYFADG